MSNVDSLIEQAIEVAAVVLCLVVWPLFLAVMFGGR